MKIKAQASFRLDYYNCQKMLFEMAILNLLRSKICLQEMVVKWEQLGVDPLRGIITGRTNKLSTYAIMSPLSGVKRLK